MNWSIFEKRMQQRMEQEHIPGAAVAVSKHGKIIYEQGFGVSDVKTQEPVTPDTIFGVASVTKSFTALAIVTLAEEGKLSLDDPVIRHLPNFYIPNINPMEAVQIHHLLTHSTGLTPMQRREDLNQIKEHLDYIAKEEHDLLGKPGEYFSYCNDAFLLLGAIIEKYTGKLYRRSLTEQILNPLKMFRSTFSVEEIHKMSNVSTPYVYDSKNGEFQEQDWPTLGNYEVGGGIRSSVIDLLKYGELYINKGSFEGKQLVSSEMLAKMSQPHISIDKDSFYGYAFKITPDYHGVTLVEHGGGQPGVSSNFGFVPEKGLAVAVLTNVSNVYANEIWLDAVNVALGKPIEERISKASAISLPLEKMNRFVGTYRSKEGTSLEIVIDNASLYAKIENTTYPLEINTEDTLMNVELGRTIRFYFEEEEAKPWAAFLGMRMLPRVS
ncbi:serine hydrolase domain-containing protein [Ornithinibacillus salinisoli]|uniref:Serine hydrolase domain-containing protein n=1 Tax=Ornithinibacillus salinisoli TaxID=1848459 RepID=A0ABW4W012_9BACI